MKSRTRSYRIIPLKAEVFMQLRLAGYDVELNAATPMGRPDVTVYGKFREQVIAFIEVKTYQQHPEARQLRRYRQAKVPVLQHYRFGEEGKVIRALKKLKPLEWRQVRLTTPLPRRLKKAAKLEDRYSELNIKASV